MKLVVNLDEDTLRVYGLKNFDPFAPSPIRIVATVPVELIERFDPRGLAAYIYTYIKTHHRFKSLPKYIQNSILRNIVDIEVRVQKGKTLRKAYELVYNPHLPSKFLNLVEQYKKKGYVAIEPTNIERGYWRGVKGRKYVEITVDLFGDVHVEESEYK